jgi:hypothetical protein
MMSLFLSRLLHQLRYEQQSNERMIVLPCIKVSLMRLISLLGFEWALD